jgi:hypothetical protein
MAVRALNSSTRSSALQDWIGFYVDPYVVVDGQVSVRQVAVSPIKLKTESLSLCLKFPRFLCTLNLKKS